MKRNLIQKSDLLYRKGHVHQGSGIVQMCGALVLGFMLTAVAIDFGLNYAAQNNLQVTADSAALAGIQELFNNDSTEAATRQASALDASAEVGDMNLSNALTNLDTSNMTFGYIDPSTKVYDSGTFTSPSADTDLSATGGYNAVRVSVYAGSNNEGTPVPTIMARLFGKSTMNTSAHAVAMFDSEINEVASGLRPIYGCVAQYDAAMADGDMTNNTIRVYNDYFTVDGAAVTDGCPPQGSGNWGFADLRDSAPGAPGNNDLSNWWMNGFDENSVFVDQYYSTQPGNSINSNGVRDALDSLVANQTKIMIPLIDTDYTGSGSDTDVHVVGFIGMVITGYEATGPEDSLYIEGYFTDMICASACRTGDTPGTGGSGVVMLRLVH